jgi:serine/threonine protein kinase/tetratricopeptide (TPR) repeat protein
MNWPSVERLFAAALEIPLEDRQALLDSDPDEAVRAEVRRLLARHDALASGHDSFLNTLDLHQAATLVEAVEPDDPSTIGRYEIVRRLGSGATGVVYLARDPSLGRLVALKLLSPDLSHDATGIRRFTDEARATSRLDNPHIVAVHEIGRSEDDRLFIAMAYHEGETLRERIGRGPIPVEEAMRIADDVAEGLSAAHARQIVHRDIKPENILLTARGACIVDFGIAKVAGETLTRTGAALGTAAYMSPEQTRGTGVDHRSDLWSLGVVLYEMLTGRRPFQADGGEALIYRIRHDAAEPIAARRPDVAPALARLVDRCLEKEPERRHQSAAALLSELRAPLPSVGTVPARRWRHIGLVGGVAVVTAAVVTAAVLAAPGRRSPGEPLPQLSTAQPLPRQPGAIAIVSPSDDRSYDPVVASGHFSPGCNIKSLREPLVRGLSGTPGFHVASRSSVRIAVEAGADVPELGRRLGVTTVLEWDCRLSDGLVHYDARLIRASDGRSLWSGAYERPIGERAAVPEEIRRSVAGALGLGNGDSADAPRGPTTDLLVYELYMRGQHAHAKNTPAGLEEAARLFRQAIARDSSFGLAYARLADVSLKTWSGAAVDRYHRVKPLFARAVELDSTLAFAHGMLGWIAMWQDRDWAEAERHLVRALALDSSDVSNYYKYAALLAATGRTAEGLEVVRRATALDPLSSVTATEVGLHLYWNRRYPEAIAVLERALVVDTIWWQKMPMVLGRAYLAVRRYDDAILQFRRAGQQSSEGFEAPALLAYALGLSGRTHEARAIVTQYEERARASSARPIDLVAVQLGLGDTARALDWLERTSGDRGSRFYPFDPVFDPIRGSARFRRVLEELGLAAAVARADSLRPRQASRRERS